MSLMGSPVPGPSTAPAPVDVTPGRHWAARPLPEPPRSRRVSQIARQPLDRLGQLLEQWLQYLGIGNTIAGD